MRAKSEFQSPKSEGQAPDIAARINAGWLRLWKAVYPNTPPPGEGRSAKAGSTASAVRSSKFSVSGPGPRRPAAVDYLSSLLSAVFALLFLTTGCGLRPLKGGRAMTTRKPGGIVEQALTQGDNAAQATKQEQGSVKVRTYTVPAGSRFEQTQPPGTVAETQTGSPAPANRDSSAASFQPAPAFILSGPMPVIEREENHARVELGAAQQDNARELGARLSSLKGLVWLGAGLFVLGLASLVWPPLKLVIGSVTTSAAIMLGGLALMLLPSLVVGHELLILGVVALGVGGWFLAHRHGQLRGMVAASSAANTPGTPTAGS